MRRKEATTAIIGGSGLYEMEGLEDVDFIEIDTPFGKPSDAIMLGSLEEEPVAFLPRHGRGHRINPSHIPVRANIYALKTLGVQRIISVSAVGSLKEELHRKADRGGHPLSGYVNGPFRGSSTQSSFHRP